jgi:hypothetical protein
MRYFEPGSKTSSHKYYRRSLATFSFGDSIIVLAFVYLVVGVFLVAGLLFYGFLLRPLIATYGPLERSESLTVLASTWGICTFTALVYSGWDLWRSRLIAKRIGREREELGTALTVLETELNQRLPQILDSLYKHPAFETSESEHINSDTVQGRRAATRPSRLRELYDLYLEIKRIPHER